MKMWQKYIEKTDAIKPILEVYLKLRRWFQLNEWTQSDLENPPYYGTEMMELKGEFRYNMVKIFQNISDLGLDITQQEFNNYLHPFITKIDELTPLKNGNNKRRNKRDEDN
jgi:hypothetical protein